MILGSTIVVRSPSNITSWNTITGAKKTVPLFYLYEYTRADDCTFYTGDTRSIYKWDAHTLEKTVIMDNPIMCNGFVCINNYLVCIAEKRFLMVFKDGTLIEKRDISDKNPDSNYVLHKLGTKVHVIDDYSYASTDYAVYNINPISMENKYSVGPSHEIKIF